MRILTCFVYRARLALGPALVLGAVWLASIGTASIETATIKTARGDETDSATHASGSVSSADKEVDNDTSAEEKEGHAKADDGGDKKNKNQDNDGKAKKKAGKGKQQRHDGAQREAVALALVREHHGELIELLDHLKSQKHKAYLQAIQELWRASERLATVRQRDPDRYDLELRAWKIDSRIRLLAAKLSMEQDPELEQQLKSALSERADVRLQLKTVVRDRVKTRLETMNAEIDKLTSEREQQLQQAFDKLVRGAAKARAKAGVAKPPASEKLDAKPAIVPEAGNAAQDDSSPDSQPNNK
jgi:hypothetical protein